MKYIPTWIKKFLEKEIEKQLVKFITFLLVVTLQKNR